MSSNSLDTLYAEHRKFGRYITRQQVWHSFKSYISWRPNPSLAFGAVAILVLVGVAGTIASKHGQPRTLGQTSASTSNSATTDSKSHLSVQNQLAPEGNSAVPSATSSNSSSAAPSAGVSTVPRSSSAPASSVTNPLQSAISPATNSCNQTLKQQYANNYNRQKQVLIYDSEYSSLGLNGSRESVQNLLNQLSATYQTELQSIHCTL